MSNNKFASRKLATQTTTTGSEIRSSEELKCNNQTIPNWSVLNNQPIGSLNQNLTRLGSEFNGRINNGFSNRLGSGINGGLGIGGISSLNVSNLGMDSLGVSTNLGLDSELKIGSGVIGKIGVGVANGIGVGIENKPKANSPSLKPAFTLNPSGIPVPTLEYLQSELSQITSTEQMVGKDSVFAKLFQNTINAVLQAEMENHLGYGSNQKTGVFKTTGNGRNGYNTKNLKSQYGKVSIEIPRDRQAQFDPQIVAKHQTTTNDLEHQILALYAMGNSTSEISQHFKEIYGFDISDQYVSTVTEKVLPLVKEWLNRPLQALYPIVYLDAIRYKVREGGGINGLGGKIVNKAVYIALGIGLDGTKEILGLYISQTESSKFWMSVLSDIKQRGVQDILIVSTDNLTGFSEAIKSIFPDIKHQKCIIHQIRNSTKFVSYKDLKQFTQDLKLVYTARDENQAKEEFQTFKSKWNKDYGYAIKSWESNWAELMSFMEYPQEIRTVMYTNNTIEGLNRQLRKATSKRSVYPNDEALLKNLYLVITKLNKNWTMSIRNWGKILNQLTILFPERITKYINA